MTLSFEERLNKHPELRTRMENILDIAEGKGEGPDTADVVEERAIAELNKLGRDTLTDWAKDKVAREVEASRNEQPEAKLHKKK